MSRRTPTQPRAQATRRSILDATMSLMERNEPEAITTGMVADAAGVPVGSVYRYFRDRGDIFRALCQELMDRVDEPLEALLRRDEPVEALIEETLELLVATSSEADLRLVRVLKTSPELAEIEMKSNQRVGEILAGALGARNPALKPVERRAGATVLMRAVLSFVEPIMAEADPAMRDAVHREAVRMAGVYARLLTEEGRAGLRSHGSD
ncbi:TetR/AcrR family transcriptional regulator [Sandaracinobacter sp. RS1-74]|uniref:TetR/AcrR family transcriptional regulator n=1 Tax=Sandaracinobacteroides sayramensis TaxID=2913411 RepID=UPI001EDC2256|nr:TetR/AcrR family transcriptional regulator [Sandaracinobacteroides sayramensis]MCG2841016.1 TetR/AcrR family transcriptional regulator [Sandaracinobacteroides sayramensis]